MVTRRDWWLGIALVVLAILVHAAVPRYEWLQPPGDQNAIYLLRVDRWTGRVQLGSLKSRGIWAPL
jgi:hypothetical protein